MILFDLQCAKKHVFEGWFPSGDSFDEQVAAKAITCPVCGSSKVKKAPMAPRIGKGIGKSLAHREEAEKPPAKLQEMRRQLAELRTQIESNFDYVGPGFAEEARRIHYGETEKRSIYGEATKQEAESLNEEGIEFGTVPWVPRQN